MAETDSPATPDLERKLATILSADVAAYSRLMAEDEEHTLRTFRGHREVFEKLVELHRGRIFNTAGDAILAEFGSAVEAVRCATEIQAALRTRNDQLPEDRQVRFRIGVNLGDVMVQGQDLLGDGVNVAARLQSAAEPGGSASPAASTTRSATSFRCRSNRSATSATRTSHKRCGPLPLPRPRGSVHCRLRRHPASLARAGCRSA